MGYSRVGWTAGFSNVRWLLVHPVFSETFNLIVDSNSFNYSMLNMIQAIYEWVKFTKMTLKCKL